MALRWTLRAAKLFAKGALLGGGAYSAVKLYQLSQEGLRLPESFVLDLEDFQIVESVGRFDISSPLGGVSRQKLELRQVVEALDYAGRDQRVKALLVNVSDSPVGGLAQVQELRQALQRFRQQAAERAPTFAFSGSFGEAGAGGLLPYYLAAACEKVFLQPTGMLSATGLAVQTPFLRKLLDKWKVHFNVLKREEYKNALNSATETGYTPAHRQATEELLQGFMGQIVAGIASDRSLSQDEVRAAVDASPLICPHALQRKLIDGSVYKDQLDQQIEDSQLLPGSLAKRVQLSKYVRAIRHQKAQERKLWVKPTRAELGAPAQEHEAGRLPRLPPEMRPLVAVIHASGPIYAGQGAPQVPGQQEQIAASKLCALLSRVQADARIRALVLRLDTPGGSATASDVIRRKVQQLRESGRDVTISMGNTAASGGYYIACAADTIVAEPGTITGSIGVISGKVNIEGLLQDQGVKVETIKEGRNADAMSLIGDLDPQQLQQAEAIVDWIYEGFLEKVAAGRNMELDHVRQVAKGRVWTGEAALKLRLVDRMGGLADAIALAKANAAHRATDVPGQLGPLDVDVVEIREDQSAVSAAAQLLQRMWDPQNALTSTALAPDPWHAPPPLE